jgi:hypothetical protein
MLKDDDLHSRIIYNKDLYLAYSSSKSILEVFLKEEEIKKDLEQSLIDLIITTNKRFNLFYLFNCLNLYVSSKAIIFQGGSIYKLDDDNRKLLSLLLNALENKLQDQSLLKETLELVDEKKKFKEEDAYELLNQISIECTKAEKDLYTEYDAFLKMMEKEIEKINN